MTPKLKAVLVLLLVLIAPSGCGKDKDDDGLMDPPPSADETQISDNVVVANAAGLSLTSKTETELNFSYQGSDPQVEPGDILVGTEQGGYLRHVSSVEDTGDGVRITTTEATLVDAIQTGTLNRTLSFDPESLEKAAAEGTYLGSRVNYLQKGVRVDGLDLISLNDVMIFDGQVQGDHGEVRAHARIVSGSLSFSPDLEIGFEVEDSRVKEFHTIAGGQIDFDASLEIDVSGGLNYSPEPTLVYSTSYTFVQMVGWLPVVEVVTFDIVAGYSFVFDAEMTSVYGVTSGAAISAGAQYSNDSWSPIFGVQPTALAGETSFGAHAEAEARAFVRPRISVELYSVAGPNLQIEPYVSLNGSAGTTEWCADINFGYGLDLGFSAHILDLELANFNQVLASDEIALFDECYQLRSGVLVNSIPEGATISVDGVSTGFVTPALLEEFPLGTHGLRLSLDGYNDYTVDLFYDGGVATVTAVLTQPQPPIPVITIESPEDQARISSQVTPLRGLVQMRRPDGALITFDEDTAILSLNGVDQTVAVDPNGRFVATIGIVEGANRLRVRATSSNGDTGYSDLVTVFGDFAAADIVIILSWDTPTSDLDLHVWNPIGQHAYYANKSIDEGSLDIDDRVGFGPETFTATHALEGTYTVKVNSFSLHQDDYSNAGVTVVLDGATPRTYGPYLFETADFNGTSEAAWWDVTVFQMANGTRSVDVSPADPTRVARIERDMAGLPEKK